MFAKKNNTAGPDFAYPQTVATDAEKQLGTALAAGDGQSVVDALIKYGLAETMISDDNFPTVIARIDSIAAVEKSPVTRSLLNLLLSNIYSSYYSRNRYNVDRRTTVDADSADITLMSGEQLRARVSSCIDKALADPDSLKAAPLADYPAIIEFSKDALVSYPTLFDFVSARAIYTLGDLARPARLLSADILLDPGELSPALSPVARQAIGIADSWVEANPEPGAPRINAIVSRMLFLNPYLAAGTDEGPEAAVKVYEQNLATPYSVEILLKYFNDVSGADLKTKYYGLLTGFVADNPGYVGINNVKNAIASMSAQSVNLSCPGQVAKGRQFTIDLNVTNAADFKIYIYKLKESASFGARSYSKKDVGSTPCLTIPVKVEGTVPFEARTSVTATIDDYGVYVVNIPLPGSEQSWYNTFVCSDVTLLNVDMQGSNLYGVVDVVTGAPVKGAKIDFYDQSRIPKLLASQITPADGIVGGPDTEVGFNVRASLGTDRYGRSLYGRNSTSDVNKYTTCYVHAALPVYHPGDSIDFAGVAYTYEGNTREALAGTPLKVYLNNPNYEEVGTLDVRTDDFGRFSGKFAIPDEGLTGNFIIYVGSENNPSLGRAYVMVSDYKLPTYEVEMDKTEARADGTVVVSGKAMTYSGFPVASADVELTLSATRYFWFFDSQTSRFDTLKATTAADGSFKFELTPDVLALSPFPKGYITAGVLVTSPTGENRSAETHFSLGKPFTINVSTRGTLFATPGQTINATLLDRVGSPVDTDLLLTFARGGKSVEIKGRATASGTVADLSALRSGTYTLTVTAPGHDAEPQSVENVVVYNAADTKSPSDALLWTLNDRLTVPVGKPAGEFTYAVPVDNASVLMVVSVRGNVVERRWLRPAKGVNRQKFTLPADTRDARITLLCVNDLRQEIKTLNVAVTDPADRLTVKVERMRDRLVPLKRETISLTVTDGSGKGQPSAVILDMYAKSLDAIVSDPWDFSPVAGYLPGVNVQTNRPYAFSYYSSSNTRSLPYYTVDAPCFNFYGETFGVRRYKEMYGSVRASAMKLSSTVEMEAEALPSVAMVSGANFDDAVMEDADCGVVEAVGPVEEAVEEDGKQKAEQTYRPSEIPLAFFAPTLTTGEDGSLTYTFTVPDANTTWVLNALAFNAQMITDMFTTEVISAKPLMVEPNLPRFIRQGDTAEVRVSVMNASETVLSPTTVFEILDPVDRLVISTASAVTTIAPGASAVVAFPVSGLPGTDALVVRVKASTDSYSDGVQTVLPVLPDSQTVYDSQTFYLPVGQNSFSTPVEVPKAKDAVTTLTFCDNPTWEVVSALPGLLADDSGTSLSASAAFFSASVARYVMDCNPAVKDHLKQWLEGSKTDGTMLSMLNSNEDLKQLLLASTPWMSEAKSDTERITRLALLFDADNIDQALENARKQLRKLQQSDGGWAWIPASDVSSVWVTYQILNNFAELRQLGCCAGGIDDMLKQALQYIDKEVSRAYDRYPDASYFDYTDVRSLFPEFKITGSAAKAYNKTVKELRSGWKKRSTIEKAIAALILYRNGYKDTARDALNSLRQFASYKPELGMWWESLDHSTWFSLYANGQTAYILDAFNTIEPGCIEIDRIRQWLILNKVVQDWGTSVNTSACVASILHCGSDWLYKPGNVEISVGGQRVTPTDADRLTGQFVVKIDNPKGNLRIERQGDGPAWGAILTRSYQQMKQVEAASLPELVVTKEILVNDGNGWVAASDLKVGQVAKIRLVIDSARDMDYVTIVDNRAACMEPVVQTPRNVYCDGLVFYLENRNAQTNLFISRLFKGRYVIEYEMNVNNAGEFASGLATIQSQYTPEMTAHSAGNMLTIK